jgi:hypothetical protein
MKNFKQPLGAATKNNESLTQKLSIVTNDDFRTDSPMSYEDEEDSEIEQEYVYTTNPGAERLHRGNSVAMRTRVFDTEKLAQRLIASTKYNESKTKAFKTLSVDELSAISAKNMWKVIPPKGTFAPKTSKAL